MIILPSGVAVRCRGVMLENRRENSVLLVGIVRALQTQATGPLAYRHDKNHDDNGKNADAETDEIAGQRRWTGVQRIGLFKTGH